MAELTKLTGTYIRSGSIPTTALSGGVVSSSLQIISALPTGSVSSSAQVAELLPVGTLSSSTQVDYTVLSNVPAGIASSSAQITAYLPTDTVSSSGQVTTFLPTGTVSQSAQIDITGTTNYTSFSSSLATVDTAQTNRLTTLESVTGSYATTGSNTFVAPQTISDTTNSTSYLDGALHVAGGMSVRKDVRISGSMTINGLLTAVSMSTQYVTSSQYNVGVSRITLNDDDNVRFAGLSIIDSGSSSPASASIFWDSLQHRFIYENLSGSAYNSSIIIAGPKHTGSLGDEPTLTSGYLPYATGTDHIDNSVMFQSSSRIGIGTTNPTVNLDIENGSGWAGLDLNGTSGGEIRLQKNGTTYGQLYASEGGSTGFVINAAGAGNDIYFQNAGTTTMTILDSGNVGIGTASPARVLTVYTSGSASRILLQNNSTGTAINNGFDIAMETDGTATVWNYQNSYMRFATNNTERVRIDASGNVGIGTTNPSYKLDVAGIIRNVVSGSGYQLSFSDGGGSNNTYLTLYQAASSWIITSNKNGTGTRKSISITTTGGDTTAAGLFIDTSDNVGIGTTSPTQKLSINGSGGTLAGVAAISLYDTNSNSSRRWAISNGAGGNATDLIGKLVFSVGSGTSSADAISGSAAMVIDSSGNVGIGNTAPVAKLHIEGGSANWNETTPGLNPGTFHLDPGVTTDNFGNAITFGASDAGNGENAQAGIYIRSDGGYGTKMYFATTDSYAAGSKTRVYISHDGNVGIGTTDPAGYRLNVIGGATRVASYLSFGDNGYIRGDSSGWLQLQGGSTGTRIMESSNTAARVTVLDGGNVGIGTSNPNSRLSINGGDFEFNRGSGALGSYYFRLNKGATDDGGILLSTDNVLEWQIINNSTTGDLGFYSYGAAAQVFNIKKATGNVGIGTTNPTYKLQVHTADSATLQNGLNITNGANTDYTVRIKQGETWVGPTTTTAVVFQTNNSTEAMRITAGGNIGIGTTNPLNKLHIYTGSVIAGSTSTTGVPNPTGITTQLAFEARGTQTGNHPSIAFHKEGVYTFYLQGQDTQRGLRIYGPSNETAPGLFVEGNVGIGTTSPGYKLHVNGDIVNTTSVGSTGDAGIQLGNGHRLGFDQAGTRSWTVKATGGNLQFFSGDNSGYHVFSAGGVGIGTTNPGSYKLQVQGDTYVTGTLTEGSSIALKKNINPITDALNIINNLTGYTFDRTDSDATNQAGLIAEEVAEVLPGVVSLDQDGNPSGVQYTKIIAYLVESIKELKSELDVLKRQ